MQRTLERLLDVPFADSIENFLVTGAEAARLGNDALKNQRLEALYIVGPQKPFPELGVFVDSSVLQKLEASCPYRRLDAENFEAFLLALEGVSHFVMLQFCLSHQRQVRLVELERQADLDKWVLCYLLLRAQGRPSGSTLARALSHRLFTDCGPADWLPSAERERYALATQRAERQVQNLLRKVAPRYLLWEVVQAARRCLRQVA